MDFLTVVTVVIFIAHAVLLLFTVIRGRERGSDFRWLTAVVTLALVTTSTFLLREDLRFGDRFGRGIITTALLIALTAGFGVMVIDDAAVRKHRPRLRRIWFGVNAVWLVGTLLVAAFSLSVNIGQIDWLAAFVAAPDVTTIIAVAGLVVTGSILLGLAFYDFYEALMPEVANRALFWALVSAALLLSVVTVSSGAEALIVVGLTLMLVSMAAAVYAHIFYRVIDVRRVLALAARALTLIIITSVIVFLTLILAYQAELRTSGERTLVFIALALVAATLYVPLRQLAEIVFQRLFAPIDTDSTLATRKYSQQVSQAVELKVLVQAATTTLNELLRIRRSGLMLVSGTGEGTVELLVISGGGFASMDNARIEFKVSSPVYQTLAAERRALLQFDIEFSPQYKQISPEERRFFRLLQMSVYAPIVVENVFIGILACGPKISDTSYSKHDLELLATLAHQTGVALRNARLLVDMRHLNESMKSLNRGLEAAKEELEKLDSVKTDFITIASHELRTPLAQIRGYTDIIDALNEQGLLDQDQIKGLVSNLRKATERTEELIAAMLDVSQLDVNAMDLRFAQTTPESVMRLAIEPLTDAIKQRKLTLSARGLRGLPPIQADMQRLVQAFRNIIVNAIKFTPDGGQIEINAALQEAKPPDKVDRILITIQDTGVGIAKENLQLIFGKFYRAYDPSLHSTGTYKFLGAGPGLGLTIAKGVIEGHGGKIWAESSGHDMKTFPGSTFYVLLPVSPPEDARRVLPFEGDGKTQYPEGSASSSKTVAAPPQS